MAEIDWRAVEADAFPEDDRERIALFTATVGVDSPGAAALLLDPLPLLIENLPGVERDWSVTLERVNAEVRVPRRPRGPRKIIFVWTLIRPLRRVHGLAYRVGATEDEEQD